MMADERTTVEMTAVAAAIATGLLVSVGVGFATARVEMRLGVNLMTNIGVVPLPLGAMLIGAAAMTMHAISMRLVGLRVNPRTVLGIGSMVGAASLVFCHRFCYQEIAPGGMTFPGFVHQMVTAETGIAGYLVAAAQIAAFAVGGWIVTLLLAPPLRRDRASLC